MIAEIIIQSNVKKLDKTFDYEIPIELEKKVKIGSRVLVQFGNRRNLEDGFVNKGIVNHDIESKYYNEYYDIYLLRFLLHQDLYLICNFL